MIKNIKINYLLYFSFLIFILIHFTSVFSAPLLYTPTCQLKGEIITIEFKDEFVDNCTIDRSCPIGAFIDYLPKRYEITINISNIRTLENSNSDCLLVFRRNTLFTMNLPLEDVHSKELLQTQNIITSNLTFSLTNTIESYEVYDPRLIPPPPEKPKTIFGLFWEWLKTVF